MTEPFAARARLDQLVKMIDAAQVEADDQEVVLRRLQDSVRTGRATDAQVAAAAARHADLQQQADQLRNGLSGARDELTQLMDALPPLFPDADSNPEPIALLPVRLETTWWDEVSLRVRVYPDDIHISGLVPELTPDEARLAAGYWRDPGPAAWEVVTATLRPDRAAWAVRASRPGGPAPVVREDADGPRQRSVAMPHHWRFVGFVDGEVVVDQDGRQIPDPLPIGLLREEDGWETDWFNALKNGMGIELRMGGLDHLDQLFVVGVRDEPAEEAAARLRDLLLGHTFGAGLGFLAAGTPTNNTPGTRSGWSSRPSFPPPGDDPANRPAADALATALGLPDAGFLGACAGSADLEPAALAGLSLLTWCTLGKGFAESVVSHVDLADGATRGVESARPWRAVRDHLVAHVRSRGPLPTVRVGRQPYGVLPTSGLSDWRADRDRDVDGLIAPWLLRARRLWRALVEDIPRVRPDQPVDQVTVDALTRLPVATGLAMRRMDGPAFTIPRIGPAEPPNTPGIPGLAPDTVLRWTNRSDRWTDLGWGLDETTGVPGFVTRFAGEVPAFTAKAVATADYFRDVRAFLAGTLTAADYDRTWPVELSSGRETPPRPSTFFDLEDPHGVLSALVFLPNWAFMAGDDPGEAGIDDPVRRALAVTGDVDQLVADVLDNVRDSQRDEKIRAAARAAATLASLEGALRAVAAVPPERLAELLLEVVDVYSHRLDAWVTSLAAGRLAAMRADRVAGVRLGGYGWLENVRRPTEEREKVDLGGEDGEVFVSQQDGYIHAPSLQHAAAAAVLRSGSLEHPGEEAFSINLTSRRARIARWLLAGVRQGQSLGALLGYRFERALHDADLDTEIDNFRKNFPIPTVPEPAGPDTNANLWSRSSAAIAARNVVDGMALAADPDAAQFADEPGKVAPIHADLVATLDAVADLVLAESVHQLVGGNPLRAGLAADTLGRGGDVPDTFHTLRTPHRARAITNRVATLLAVDPAPAGWAQDPLSRLEPGVEGWLAHLLGPAAGWTLTGTVGAANQPFQLTADRLGLSALSTVLDAASAEQPRLRAAITAAAGVTGPVVLAGPGWTGLHGMAVRLRSLLANAQPLLPSHLPAATPPALDISDARRRLGAFAADPSVASLPGAADLAALATAPDDTGWLTRARDALAEVVGAELPLLPRLAGPAPTARADVGTAAAGEWLARLAAVRPAAHLLHETLSLAGVRGGHAERLRAAQDPDAAGDAWVGGVFDAAHRPAARTHLVWHLPAELPATGPMCGLVLDEWAELLPGADRIRAETPIAPAASSPAESELTGLAFHYDRPDAKAPHTVLVAVPPDLERPWTSDGLVQVLRETLELAKLRAVDLSDLGVVGALVPGIRIPRSGATGDVLAAVETFRPGVDETGPFRLETWHRTSIVDPGLAAKVHDPLWLLTRQWQFGEFAGQDAGSPALVRLAGASSPIDAWRPAGATDWVPYDVRVGPLDPPVEAELAPVDERLRAEGGVALLRMLDEAGTLAAAAGSLAPHLLAAGTADETFVGLLAGRAPDAAAVAAAIDGGLTALGDVGARWRRWWAERVAGHGPDCFDPHRFEHAAAVSTGGSVLRAEEYLGDGLDWYTVDVDPDADAAPASEPYRFSDEALPSTVRYGGLPADRFWEMEDARVDLGATEVSTLDTGRLLLIAFATVFGNDWFLVPLEVPAGSLTVLDRVLVRDVFGRDHLVKRAGSDDPTWSMFTLHSPDPEHPAAGGLLVMPTEHGHAGEPLERVGLARDELANLAWAVEHRYTDGRGDPVEWRDRMAPPAPQPVTTTGLAAYGVQTDVPDNWFPLVPEAVKPSVIHFRLADLNAPGATAHPMGKLLTNRLWVHEEEVPREGAAVFRRPVLARWFDGSWHAWVRREKAPGTGESSSGLAFDTVRPTDAWPG